MLERLPGCDLSIMTSKQELFFSDVEEYSVAAGQRCMDLLSFFIEEDNGGRILALPKMIDKHYVGVPLFDLGKKEPMPVRRDREKHHSLVLQLCRASRKTEIATLSLA
jgi:hypothetical protein